MQLLSTGGVPRATTAVLDDREQRHATARAQAAAIVDSPRHGRRFEPARDRRLQGSPRRRSHARGPARVKPRVHWTRGRRLIAVAVLVGQVTLLALALLLPAFQVHGVSVTGTQLVNAQDVVETAAVPRQSIFTVDASAVRQRLLALPWLQNVTVSTELPATVRIAVVERTPALRVRRDGADSFIAGNGATAPATAALERAWSASPVLLDDRAGTRQPLAPLLVQQLSLVAQRFPAVFGGSVAAFQWGVDDAVSIWSAGGWRAILGHLDTQDDLSALPAQLTALAQLRGQLNFARPTFGYVDLENPAAPAVGGSPGLPREVLQVGTPPSFFPSVLSGGDTAGVPLPTPQPSPSPTPSAGPSASPNAAPTPNGFTIIEPAPPRGH